MKNILSILLIALVAMSCSDNKDSDIIIEYQLIGANGLFDLNLITEAPDVLSVHEVWANQNFSYSAQYHEGDLIGASLLARHTGTAIMVIRLNGTERARIIANTGTDEPYAFAVYRLTDGRLELQEELDWDDLDL